MITHSEFDYVTPYAIMVGYWAGLASVYDAKGNYVDSTESRVAIYWKEPGKVMHFRQAEEDTEKLAKEHARWIFVDFDLTIDGKSCSGASKTMAVTGIESSPGVYLFHLKSKGQKGEHYYNNQYFIDPNERHIIGPCVTHDGEISSVISQACTRISYDVRDKFKREMPK